MFKLKRIKKLPLRSTKWRQWSQTLSRQISRSGANKSATDLSLLRCRRVKSEAFTRRASMDDLEAAADSVAPWRNYSGVDGGDLNASLLGGVPRSRTGTLLSSPMVSPRSPTRSRTGTLLSDPKASAPDSPNPLSDSRRKLELLDEATRGRNGTLTSLTSTPRMRSLSSSHVDLTASLEIPHVHGAEASRANTTVTDALYATMYEQHASNTFTRSE